MRKARHRAKLSVKGRFSKKPGLVSTMGRTKFIRSLIRNRASCNDGCIIDVKGIFIGTFSSQSPLEIPLTFSKPITVNWDDEINPLSQIIQPGERVIHFYSKNNPPNKVDADPRLGSIEAGALGNVNPRNITIRFSSSDNVKLDYSEEAGSYFKKHKDAGTAVPDSIAPGAAAVDLTAIKGLNTVGALTNDFIEKSREAVDTISSWGDNNNTKKPSIELRSLEGASKLTTISAKHGPKFGDSLKGAFKGTSELLSIKSIKKWNTKSVKTMESMFENSAKFQGNVGEKFDLDTTNVKNMKSMFKGAEKFNTDLGDKFKTENVETMESMFEDATAFNKAINFETPSLGTNAKGGTAAKNMFKNAAAFNQDVSKLDFRNVTAVTDTYFGVGVGMGAAKKAKLGEKKAVAKDGILKVESKTPFYFQGTVTGGTFATGYVDQSLYHLDKDNKAMKFMTGGLFASINKPGTIVSDQYKMINYKNNRILGIEVRHTNTTDTSVSQPALDIANVYIYFSKPVTLTSVKIAKGDGTTLTTHNVGSNNLHKVSTAAGALDNAATPTAFPAEEKNLLIKGIGGTRPPPNTVYRLTGVDAALFGNGITAYPGVTKTQGIRVILE
jgi:hypothetical protein